jgi:hypothetical protein
MDNDNINFNELWQGQTANQLPTVDLLKKVNKYKTSNYIKIVLSTLTISLTSFFICWIWISYNPQLFTTKLGIVLTILAMAIYGYSLNQLFPLLKKMDDTNSNAEHLANLLSLKKKQQFLQTKMLNLYFIMLSLGVGLYMIEPTSNMTLFWAIFAYAITALWVLFNWFYLRPRQIKKQQKILNDMISKFENIQVQMNKE